MEFTEGQVVVIGKRNDNDNTPVERLMGVHARLIKKLDKAGWGHNVFRWKVRYLDYLSEEQISDEISDDVFLPDDGLLLVREFREKAELEHAIHNLLQIEREISGNIWNQTIRYR